VLRHQCRADGVDAVDSLERSAIERAPCLLRAQLLVVMQDAGMPDATNTRSSTPPSACTASAAPAIVASSSRSSRWCLTLGCLGTSPDRLHAVIRATAGLALRMLVNARPMPPEAPTTTTLIPAPNE
jgi:hypothetical protein